MIQFASLSLLGTTVACECGKSHEVLPRELWYGPDCYSALVRIAGGAAGRGLVAVMMDKRTRKAAGDRVVDLLQQSGLPVMPVVVPDQPDGGSPICDDVTHDAIISSLGAVTLIVTVGSGVINDLGKWIAGERGIPFISFATALSMNGYASANVAPTLNGVKSAVMARPAIAVLGDPEVLANAPYRLTTAGLGDIMAKSVSIADWHLSHELFGDYLCERSTGLISDIEPEYLDHPENVRDREPRAIEALFSGLVLTGLATAMAGSSQPASGGEHVVSHGLDMLGTSHGGTHELHGRQVGVATILVTELYRRILAVESPDFSLAAPPEFSFWGRFSAGMEKQFAGKQKKMEIARAKLAKSGEWDRLRTTLDGIARRPEVVRDCLRRADAAWRAEDIGLTRDYLRDVFVHAREMRPRFTVLDLAFMAGIMPRVADDIIETV